MTWLVPLLWVAQGQNQGVGRPGRLWVDFAGRVSLQANAGNLQNPVLCGCKTEVPVSLVAVSYGLSSPCFLNMAPPSQSRQWCTESISLALSLSDFFFLLISSPPARESSLLLKSRAHVIRLGWSDNSWSDNPELSPNHKIPNLNYICKVSFASNITCSQLPGIMVWTSFGKGRALI